MIKLVYTLCFITVMIGQALAQVPTGMNYQASLRNTDGTPMANENITVVIEIFEGSANGVVVLEEIHSTNTNAQGVMSIVIGEGAAVVGDISIIDWASDKHFLGLTVDGNAIETVELQSVPYARYAQKSGIAQSAACSAVADSLTGFVNSFEVEQDTTRHEGVFELVNDNEVYVDKIGGLKITRPSQDFYMTMDNEEIQVFNSNGSASTLWLNYSGGHIVVGENLSNNGILFISKETEIYKHTNFHSSVEVRNNTVSRNNQNMLPQYITKVDLTGNVLAGTQLNVSQVGVGVYDIFVPGADYSQLLATVQNTGQLAEFSSIDFLSDRMRVYTFDKDGNADSDTFIITIY